MVIDASSIVVDFSSINANTGGSITVDSDVLPLVVPDASDLRLLFRFVCHALLDDVAVDGTLLCPIVAAERKYGGVVEGLKAIVPRVSTGVSSSLVLD